LGSSDTPVAGQSTNGGDNPSPENKRVAVTILSPIHYRNAGSLPAENRNAGVPPASEKSKSRQAADAT